MKYNWNDLKKEFILGDYKSISAFLEEKGIKRSGTVQKKTRGWKEEKAQKEIEKSSKVIEKVIEKEAEKEATEIANINDAAKILIQRIIESDKELRKYLVKKEKKSKTVVKTKSPKTGEITKEIIDSNTEVQVFDGIIDRKGLKYLTSALRDLKEILVDKENTTEDINNNIQNIADLINNPSKVRKEEDFNE